MNKGRAFFSFKPRKIMPHSPSRLEGTREERADLPIEKRLNDCRNEAGRIADMVATLRFAILWQTEGGHVGRPKHTHEPLTRVIERAIQDLMDEAEYIRDAQGEGRQ